MTVQHAVMVLESDGFVSPSQKLVLIEIAYRADRKGIVRRSQSEIAADCALSRRTVAQWFAAFETSGVLVREGHGRYRLCPDADLLEAATTATAPTRDERTEIEQHQRARAELKRLQAIRKPGEAICYTDDRWPVLREVHAG